MTRDYTRPGEGFESNGQGYCRNCGKTRVEFGFMPGKCECTRNKYYVSNPSAKEKNKESRED